MITGGWPLSLNIYLHLKSHNFTYSMRHFQIVRKYIVTLVLGVAHFGEYPWAKRSFLNFSLLCVFKCLLKSPASADAKSYWLHYHHQHYHHPHHHNCQQLTHISKSLWVQHKVCIITSSTTSITMVHHQHQIQERHDAGQSKDQSHPQVENKGHHQHRPHHRSIVFCKYLVNEEEINLQSLEDMQVGYILQKYTLERAFKPSHTFSSI